MYFLFHSNPSTSFPFVQYPHLAPTYAAVNALCIIGTDEALSVVNRWVKLYNEQN